MPRLTIFTGNNCHADVVVEYAERNPSDIEAAKALMEGSGFEVAHGQEPVIGHFCVWGASHAEGEAAHFSPVEIEQLDLLGELRRQTA